MQVMEAETRHSLKDVGCDSPGCTHDHSVLYFYPRCHPESSLYAAYHKKHGVVKLFCSDCNQHVVTVKVAA